MLGVKALIDEHRETIRSSNELSEHVRRNVFEALDYLNEVLDDGSNLGEQDDSRDDPSHMEDAKSYFERYKDAVRCTTRDAFDATNMAQATVPLAIILGCGAIGSLFAGELRGLGQGCSLGT